METLNKHCSAPFISRDKTKWYIQFWYRDSENHRKPYKKAYDLNSNEFLKKVNSEDLEINKKARTTQANALITSLTKKLSKEYFNPDNRLFQSLDKSDLPFISYLKEYVNYNPRKKRSQSTKDLYSTYNNVISEWLESKEIKNIALNEVSRELIVEFLDNIESQGTTSHRDNYLRYIKGCFKMCVDYKEVLTKNPLQLVNTINDTDSKTNRAYTDELLTQVLDETKKLDIHLCLLLRLMYYTLRRPSELLQLQYQDFDFKKGTIVFPSDIIKTNRTLYSHLTKGILNELKQLIPDNVKATDYLFGYSHREGAHQKYIKNTFAQHPTPYRHLQDQFKTIKERIKLPKGFTLYSFKHTGVKYLIENKWSEQDIIAYTGHSDVKILGRYSRDAIRPVKEHTGTI